MALHIVEQASRTDVGRQRSSNEDAMLAEPPFFAVADGMGGAKAGEVASHLATEAFATEEDPGAPPERRLEQIAHDANRRIHELAERDESRHGMGTTLTAALIADDEVSLGHVGDSRAYRLRDGGLEQLTRDHSLVAELQRSGQLSAEAAEHHPQRSIITRALGPEAHVEVDTYTVPARAGDVYLLCSDGLTTMISDEEVGSLLRGSSGLEEAAEGLVRSANQSGGKDNITVVLFRLEGDVPEDESPQAMSGEETIVGGLTAADVRAAAGARSPPSEPERSTRQPGHLFRAPAAPRRRSRGRRLALALKTGLGLLALVALAVGAYAATRQVHFVGTNDAGLVTVYRGLPYDLPLGVSLYEEKYASGVPAGAIPRGRRQRVLDHDWRGRGDALDLVRQLERGRLEPGVER